MLPIGEAKLQQFSLTYNVSHSILLPIKAMIYQFMGRVTVMKFHHVCINVSGMEEALKLYRDVLGFTVVADKTIPDGKGPDNYFDQQTLDDIFHVKNSKSRMALLVSDERSLIELEQPIIPKIQKVPRKNIQ